jgi:iron(III) transport system permease protein
MVRVKSLKSLVQELYRRLLPYTVILIVGILVLVPLSMLLLSSFHTGRPGLPGGEFSVINYVQAYSNPNTYLVLGRTFYFAGATTLLALSLGGFFAWLISRTNMPGHGIAYTLMLSPLAIPTMLLAIAWVLLLSAKIGLINKFLQAYFGLSGFDVFSMGGMIWVQGMVEVPTAFLMVLGALRSMDPSLEEAASVSRSGNFSTLRQITLPIMAPAFLAAAIYLFTVNIEVFEIPGIIGLPARIAVFSTAIYANVTVVTPPNYGLAYAYAVTYLILSIILIAVYRKATRHAERYSTVTGKGYRPRLVDLRGWKYAALAAFIGFFIVTIVLPVLVMLYASLLPLYEVPSWAAMGKISLQNYRSVLTAPWLGKVLKNTLLLMAVAPTAVVFLAAMVAWVVYRVRVSPRIKASLDILSFLPLSFPSIVIALCLLIAFLKFTFIPIYGTIWIIALAFVIRYLAYTTRTLGAAILQIHKELEESAQICHATEITSFFKITLPLIIPAVVNAWIWVAVHAGRSVTAALMLQSKKNEVLATMIWELWTDGDISKVGALAILMIAVLAGISLIGNIISTKMSRGKQ